jgi:tetratricopeptide (TPR) repeat protein
MRDELNQALTLAEGIGDEPRQARSSADLSHFFWLTGRLRDAIEAGERAQSLARAAGDAATELRAGVHVGQAYHARGEYQQAIDILRPLREALQGKRANELGGPRFSVYVGTWLAWSLAAVGQFAGAIVSGEDNVRIAESLDDSFCLCHAYLSLGVPHLLRGNAAEAIRILERNLELLRVSEVTLLVPMSTAVLGSAYTLAGRVAEALPLLERAVADDYARPGEGQGGLLGALSNGHLRAGHPGAALDLAQRALDRSREVGNRGDYARILWLFGEIHAAQDPSDSERSASSYREALTSADELGMRPLVAHCHLGLGKLYRRTGERDQAHEHITTATAMYREMDMRFWLEQAVAAALGGASV